MMSLMRPPDRSPAFYQAATISKALAPRLTTDPAELTEGAAMDVMMTAIGRARTPFGTTSEIPKGPDAKHDAEGVIEIEARFQPGLQDIEGFSHLYVLWFFHRVDGYDLVAYPPADDRPHGVFATRSPRRPSPIGLTVVQLLGRDGTRLHVRGVDMLDGTPVLDLKPYLSRIPAGDFRRGWLAEAEPRRRSATAGEP
jgi:tRNA-Thr(GGU) m(6)t(6)A37 methyltransferase TsaA